MFGMNRKGQGALEYLLLIGGAVVVASVVVVLLLNLGSSSSGSSSLQAASGFCIQKAALNNDCDWNGAGTGTGVANVSQRVVYVNSQCYACQGSTPNCSAAAVTGYSSTTCISS